jgi:PAS domain S-box-containing protein
MPSQLSLIPHDMAALRGILGVLSDPVLLLDPRLHICEVNAAAIQQLGVAAGQSAEPLRTTQQGSLLVWLTQASTALNTKRQPPPAPLLALPDGRVGELTLVRLQAGHLDDARWMLQVRLRGLPGPAALSAPASTPIPISASASAAPIAPLHDPELPSVATPWARELIRTFWLSPFPAALQDADFRLLAVNLAYLEFTGLAREQLLGSDPIGLHPPDVQAQMQSQRQHMAGDPQLLLQPHLIERRLLDAQGLERWYRASIHALGDGQQAPQYLTVMQDCTAEHAAREHAERSLQELEQWFDLSPMGMVLFDEAGLLVRSNANFAALSLELPATLHEAPPALQQLLGWQDGRPRPDLQPGARQIEIQCTLLDPQGRTRWLRSLLRCHATPSGQRRYMAVIEDRSLEEERDLAHQQLDALMDTAGVGLATFQQDAGWLRPRRGKGSGGSSASPSAASSSLASLQGVNRDMVEAASLPEFERLQQALKKGDKVEVRYAVRHPDLGLRWLLTRVEPGRLASGQRTTSVVTLDVTVQQQAQARNAQLLHELATIIDSTSVGIAYLRGKGMVRCNQRFEQMLNLPAHTAAGTPVAQLFASQPELLPQIESALEALGSLSNFEVEFMQPANAGQLQRWLSLSLRRVLGAVPSAQDQEETIAVVTDISRLKMQQAELQALAHDRELMFSLTDVGIAILRQDRIERANGALAMLSGYRINELIGLDHARLFESADDYQHQQQAIDNALRRNGRWSGERRLRRQDGSGFWVQVSKRLMHEGDLNGGVIASYVSVDERWRAQQSLLLQTERTRAILDSVLVGIVTVGRGGIEWMNRSARRMFGGDLAEFVGQPMSIVATPDPDHPLRQTHYLDELTEGQAETFECRLRGRDGREFWVVGNAVVTGLEASGRQLTYALLDIERRRQAEALTLQAQASLQRIIETAPLAISAARRQQPARGAEPGGRGAGRPAGRRCWACTPEQMFGRASGPRLRPTCRPRCMWPSVTQREYHAASVGGRRASGTRATCR